jgi:hypothetical protein
MDEREQQELAKRLVEGSEVLDFERALLIVQFRPADARRILRMREETAKRQEERAHARRRRKQALIEEFG